MTYAEAPSVRAMANRLISGKPESIPGIRNYRGGSGVTLDGLSHLRQAKIAFLFSSAEKVGRDAMAQASGFAKKLHPLVRDAFDFLIVTSRPQWDRLSEEQRAALTYHELRHCGISERDRFVVVDHEFQGFFSEVHYFGLWTERAKMMAEQMSLWDRAGKVVAMPTRTQRWRRSKRVHKTSGGCPPSEVTYPQPDTKIS